MLRYMPWKSQAKDKARVPRWAIVSSIGFVCCQYVADESFFDGAHRQSQCQNFSWGKSRVEGAGRNGMVRGFSVMVELSYLRPLITLAPGMHEGTCPHASTRTHVHAHCSTKDNTAAPVCAYPLMGMSRQRRRRYRNSTESVLNQHGFRCPWLVSRVAESAKCQVS